MAKGKAKFQNKSLEAVRQNQFGIGHYKALAKAQEEHIHNMGNVLVSVILAIGTDVLNPEYRVHLPAQLLMDAENYRVVIMENPDHLTSEFLIKLQKSEPIPMDKETKAAADNFHNLLKESPRVESTEEVDTSKPYPE
ncbi:MAG: hypothetical protein ACHQUC_09255 [Chlamydiales bacterium]